MKTAMPLKRIPRSESMLAKAWAAYLAKHSTKDKK